MISVVQKGEVYQITFRYDPMLISMIKNVPGKKWNPEDRMWTIPVDNLGWFLNEIKGTVYESMCSIKSDEHINENAELGSTADIPDIDISDVNFQVDKGKEPYGHQLDFMKYAIHRQNNGKRSGFLVLDEQGLGKTTEAFNLALYNKDKLGFKRCLVICCINTSKYNWYEDIVKHTNGTVEPYILGTRYKKGTTIRKKSIGSKEKIEDLRSGHMYGDLNGPTLPYFIITNIESFRAKERKSYTFTEEVIKLCKSGQINTIIIDEIHKNASPTSVQGKQILRIKKATGKQIMWLPMTGTPIVNKPTDLYTPLKLVDGHNFNSFYIWCRSFCIFGGYGDHDIIGYKNIPMLKGMLNANSIRRLKADVLDLPPKIYYTEYVENTKYQSALYTIVENEILGDRVEILESLNPMTKLLRLRQVNGAPELVDPKLKVDSDYIKYNAKLQRVLELLADYTERGEKTLIFSNWVEPLRTLYKFVSKRYKTCCFTGTMSEADRQKHKQVFMTNPEYKVMIGTIGAMGTTHTLTAASNIIFYDEPWTATDKQQAEDRAHRIGLDRPVNIVTILTKDTVDDRVHDIVYCKGGIASYIVDNKLDLRKNPQLFDLLFSDSKQLEIGGIKIN